MKKIIKKILLIEDDADQCLDYEEDLIDLGYEVRTAADGNSAIKQFKLFKPDLILCDYKLSEAPNDTFKRGHRLVEHIWKIFPDHHFAIVYMSIHQEDFVKEREANPFPYTYFYHKGEDFVAKMKEAMYHYEMAQDSLSKGVVYSKMSYKMNVSKYDEQGKKIGPKEINLEDIVYLHTCSHGYNTRVFFYKANNSIEVDKTKRNGNLRKTETLTQILKNIAELGFYNFLQINDSCAINKVFAKKGLFKIDNNNGIKIFNNEGKIVERFEVSPKSKYKDNVELLRHYLNGEKED
jgi:CheY-like chemotaxis protein